MKYTFWFLVGSQLLYGAEVLETVEKRAKEMAEEIFDIEGNKLFKFKLYKLKNNYGGFIVMTHHIISDAATMSIIAKEIMDNYIKLASGDIIEQKEYSYKQ